MNFMVQKLRWDYLGWCANLDNVKNLWVPLWTGCVYICLAKCTGAPGAEEHDSG